MRWTSTLTARELSGRIVKNVIQSRTKRGERREMANSNGGLDYVGGAWNKESKKGNSWVSISLDLHKLLGHLGFEVPENTKVNVALFENGKKKSEKSPDFNVVYFLPDEKQ